MSDDVRMRFLSITFLEKLKGDIQAEYERQEEQFGTFWRSIPHWGRILSNNKMSNVLTEECLEFVRAVNDEEEDDRLVEEALHTAVVALRIIETIRKREKREELSADG